METPVNSKSPTILHLDLNSCFATVEQQANPLLRGKPVVVAAYASPGGCVLAPSIEAKRYQIKTGMRVRDALRLCPGVVVLEPDPPKYRDVHKKIRELLDDYSPNVTPKSIDEYEIDFSGTTSFRRGLVGVGREIKERIRSEIGDWLFCNVGIATNRFLAKLAASLHKPDGLDVINHKNLLDVYRQIELMDFCGIGQRYKARLNKAGVFTPLEFFYATGEALQKRVFKSIGGYYWHMRLRGWEVDAVDFGRKTYGNSYALPRATSDREELGRILMKLCEKTGRRLRRDQRSARGVHLSCVYRDHGFWHHGELHPYPLYTTLEIFRNAYKLLVQQPEALPVANLAVRCYQIQPSTPLQLDIFGGIQSRKYRLANALDQVNDRFGEFVVTPALMMNMENKIIDRIAFGK
jgi:DNA polymerase-4